MLINLHIGQSLSSHLLVAVSMSLFLSIIFHSLSFYCFLYSLFPNSLSLPCFDSHPPISLSISLAVDYFWSAWLISVGSQAQCQGKQSAYKKAKRQTETSKSFSSFFSPSARHCREALSKICVCVCVCVRASKVFCLELNNVI